MVGKKCVGFQDRLESIRAVKLRHRLRKKKSAVRKDAMDADSDCYSSTRLLAAVWNAKRKIQYRGMRTDGKISSCVGDYTSVPGAMLGLGGCNRLEFDFNDGRDNDARRKTG